MSLNSCVMWPYYKELPYLPAVQGTVLDADNGGKVNEVRVSWKDEPRNEPYITQTDSEGYFEFKVIEKYITWKLIAMDPGWGGILIFEKPGYKTTEMLFGGLNAVTHVYVLNVEMERE